MSDIQNTTSNPSTPEEAQRLINELRERFDLDVAVAPHDFRRGANRAIDAIRRHDGEAKADFAARYLENLTDFMVESADYVGSAVSEGVNSRVETVVDMESFFVVEKLDEPGWKAEVLENVRGIGSRVIESQEDFDTALDAETWACERAIEASKSKPGSYSIRMTFPDSLVLKSDIS